MSPARHFTFWWLSLILLLSVTALGRVATGQQVGGDARHPNDRSDAVARTMQVAQRAFDHFRRGLATGQWQPFLDMLSDDFTFYFPTGKYQGLHVGKAKAAEFFHYVASVFTEGVQITEVLRVTADEKTVVFEFRDEGKLHGQMYKNRVAVSLDVCGDKICGYREYFGSDGKSN